MDIRQLKLMRSSLDDSLSRRRMTEALGHLEAMSMAVGSGWQIREKIDSLRMQYDYMLRYAMEGVSDPSRGEVYDNIVKEVNVTADMIQRECAKPVVSSLYFNKLRYEELQRGNTLNKLVAEYREAISKLSLSIMGGSNETVIEQRVETERLAGRLFDYVWVKYPMTNEDQEIISALLRDEAIPIYTRQQVLSALLMGALEYYDERRLVLLADTYAAGEKQMAIIALCALLLAMWMNRKVLGGKQLMARLAHVKELPTWGSDVRMVFMQFLRARDTERINRKMHDDLLPEMMKLRPEISKRMQELQDNDQLAIDEENPEWQELLESSGIADKLKELTELQADGGDVMMSTFSMLKGFDFFNEMSNWFLPFYPERSEVSKSLGEDMSSLVGFVEGAMFLCDNDKYSMAMSMATMPSVQRKLLMDQFNAQAVNMAELQSSQLLPDEKMREKKVNDYVHNLYRFFKLFRRKSEFKDPFSTPINLLELSQLSDVLVDDSMLQLVSEFYFSRQYYADAYSIFEKRIARGEQNATVYQRAGFCLQKMGNIMDALKMYERAEMLAPDSVWTLKRLTSCYRILGIMDKAAHYYEVLSALCPDNINVALNYGYCLMQQGRYSEALNQYFKAEYMDERSVKACRSLAWCLFLSGDVERASRYYDKLGDDLTTTDWLNIGHLNLVLNKVKRAIECYKKSIEMMGVDSNTKYLEQMDSDSEVLFKNGVDPLLLDIVIDATLNQ